MTSDRRIGRRELLVSAASICAVAADSWPVSGRSRSAEHSRPADRSSHPSDRSSRSSDGSSQAADHSSQIATPSIRVPPRSLVGEPLRIKIVGFEPNAPVAVEATATDVRGVEFAAEWSLRTDENGEARVEGSAQKTPETADARYDGNWTAMGPSLDAPDPEGVAMLLQQMTPRARSPTPSHFVVGEQETVDVTLTAHSTGGQRSGTPRTGTQRTATQYTDGHRTISQRTDTQHSVTNHSVTQRTDRQRASATTTRVAVDSSVTEQTLDDPELVGSLYVPPSSGPHPGVLALHGSHAVVPHALSRTLATHGYATLALQYFGTDGLPQSLDGVALEYFQRAIRWLTDRDDVRDDALGFVGVSRGVEAALLSAAGFSGPSAVVGYSGGGVVGPSVNQSATAVTDWAAAWTRDGEPIAPADPIRSVFSTAETIPPAECDSVECVPEVVRDRVPAPTLRRALAPVGDIDGPILLLAGTNDATWPAPALSALAIDRLERQGFDAPYQLRSYDGAGHVFGLPYRSYAGEATSLQYGGSPDANAFAAANSWPLVLRYLRRGTA